MKNSEQDMHPIENELLMKINSKQTITSDDYHSLQLLPLGTLSPEFYQNPAVKRHRPQLNENELRSFKLRMALEEYLTSDRSDSSLKKIETAIQYEFANKATGTYLRPPFISTDLIRQIYQLEDAPLTQLFQKHFNRPSTALFEGGVIPRAIQESDAAILKTMEKVDIKKIEPIIVKIQRHVRMKRRYREEVMRITERDKNYLADANPSMSAAQLLQDANTPYRPKCDDPHLANRIMNAAKKVVAFSTIKHITSPTAIQSIFDEGLYGRRTLIDFYLSFTKAALNACDIDNGDANTICLGPQYMDPAAKGNIIIEFDLSKLIKNKPAAFYKQRDLEYDLNRRRQVQLGAETITFNHTKRMRNPDSTMAYFETFNDDEWSCSDNLAQIPKSSCIAYDLERMHEILTLNIFRFIDHLIRDDEKERDQAYINDFYQKIANLTDDELVCFLTDLTKNMTDTAEFNFYGAHQIDFSTIINIHDKQQDRTLQLPLFIDDIKQGNVCALNEVQRIFPQLFQSYRFLDYLLLHVQHAEIKEALDAPRKQCKTPSWIKYTPTFFKSAAIVSQTAQDTGIQSTQENEALHCVAQAGI